MAMNIKNDKVERLAEELAHMTGESKTAAILRALEERKERIALGPSGKRGWPRPWISLKERSGPTFPGSFWSVVLRRKSASGFLDTEEVEWRLHDLCDGGPGPAAASLPRRRLRKTDLELV